MKKIFYVAAGIIAFSSCQKIPDLDKLTYNPIVVTSHDGTANFDDYKTYYLSDDLTLIGDDPTDSIADPSLGDPIIATIVNNMNSRGFKRVSTPDSADLGLNTAVITITTTVVTYPPYYWWGYPGYGGCYYGYCGGYYPYYGYGYSYAYQYTTGSLMIQTADLQNIDTLNHKINIVWTNFNTGVLGSTAQNLQAGIDAVNQAFRQSAYVKTN